MSFLSMENFIGFVLCLGGMNSGLRNLGRKTKHLQKNILYAECSIWRKNGNTSYFLSDATVCVLSTMTGLDGGVNFGGSSWGERRHRHVDMNPGNKNMNIR